MAIWQASRPTVIDLRIRGKAFWNEKFKFLVLEKVKDLIEDSDAVWSSPFILLFAPPINLQNFSRFCSRLPFRVFTVESHFLFFHFSLSYYALRNSSRTGGWFIKNFGWRKETTALLIMKNFSRKKTLQSKYPRSIKIDFQVCNVGQGSGFRKKR